MWKFVCRCLLLRGSSNLILAVNGTSWTAFQVSRYLFLDPQLMPELMLSGLTLPKFEKAGSFVKAAFLKSRPGQQHWCLSGGLMAAPSSTLQTHLPRSVSIYDFDHQKDNSEGDLRGYHTSIWTQCNWLKFRSMKHQTTRQSTLLSGIGKS